MDAIGRAYGAVAEQYVELFGRVDTVHADDLALIERHLGSRRGPVVDVGCGPGHLTDHLRSMGVAAIGLDLTPEMVAHARAAHPDGSYVRGAVQRLPFAEGVAAAALAWYSLIHLRPDELDAALAELRRVIVLGGALVVGFFAGSAIEAFDHKVATAHRWPVDELASRLRSAGFEELERDQRPGTEEPGARSHAALALVAR